MKTYRPLHILSGDLWGGAEAQVFNIACGFKDSEEVQTHVFLFNTGEVSTKFSLEGISTDLAEETKGFFHILFKLLHCIKSRQVNIIISHGYKEAILAWLGSKIFQIPWVHYIHGLTENYSGFKKYKMVFYSLIDKILHRASTKRIVTVNRDIAEELDLLNLDKVRIIYNATPELSAQSAIPTKSPSSIKICWMGRLSTVKRPDLAIQIFNNFYQKHGNSFPDTTLEVYGTGPMEEVLRKSISATKNITLHGFTNAPLVEMEKGSLLFLTSDSEGIPTVILEAMKLKLPIVSRMVGGIPEILELAPNYPIVKITGDSTEEGCEALLFAIKNYKDLKLKAEGNDIDFFSIKRLLADHLCLYKEII